MFYSHLNKEIMLLKLIIKRNSFTNDFIISLKRNCRNFDIILKIHFKRIEFIIRFFFIKVFILFMSKKNNELSFYIDYRELNTIIIKNRYLFSLIFETLNRLCDSKIFIKLNLKNVYYKLRIKVDDKEKTTFRTRYNYFEYLIMSFNLVNASITFQIYINKILINLINIIYIVYLNDILIYNVNSINY